MVALAALNPYRGLAFLYTEGRPIFGIDDGFRDFFGADLGTNPSRSIPVGCDRRRLPHPQLVAFGNTLKAIGTNELASRKSGVLVERTKIVAFTLSGMFATLGALLLMSRIGAAEPISGTGYELTVIAAVVVGGASLAVDAPPSSGPSSARCSSAPSALGSHFRPQPVLATSGHRHGRHRHRRCGRRPGHGPRKRQAIATTTSRSAHRPSRPLTAPPAPGGCLMNEAPAICVTSPRISAGLHGLARRQHAEPGEAGPGRRRRRRRREAPLISCLSGLFEPSSGQIFIDGVEVRIIRRPITATTASRRWNRRPGRGSTPSPSPRSAETLESKPSGLARSRSSTGAEE